MADSSGVFDNWFGGSGKGASGAGILGAQQTQPWQGTLGILASALKDATNSFSGNGDTDNLSKWNATQGQQQQRQQLIAGLTSTDPAERQKAYALAPLFNVDPSLFQKQQAAQAVPQLLSAMQPQQVTAPGAQADLTSQGLGHLNIPASPIGMAPGMGIGEALSSVNSPELSSVYGQDAIKQLMEPPKYQEAAGGLYELPKTQGGAPRQVVAPKNNPNQPFNVDGSSNTSFQSWELRKAAANSEARAEAIARNRAPPKASATGAIALPHPGSMY